MRTMLNLIFSPQLPNIKEFVQRVKTKIPYFSTKQNLNSFPIQKAGNPDPRDIEDNAMVSEGSMFAVQYHDKKLN